MLPSGPVDQPSRAIPVFVPVLGARLLDLLVASTNWAPLNIPTATARLGFGYPRHERCVANCGSKMSRSPVPIQLPTPRPSMTLLRLVMVPA